MPSINGKNFITLDNHIDIKTFLELKSEWEFLFASNLNSIKTAVWNAAGHDPEDLKKYSQIFRENDFVYFSYQRANEDRLTDYRLNQHLLHFENSNDKRGLARYLKLRYNSFDPYFALNIRKNTGSHYSADSIKLSENDWDRYYSWQPYMDKFPQIIKFIENLPLEKIGNVVIHYSEHYVPLGYHRDYNYFPIENGNRPNSYPHREEFIWLRFDLDRPFYILEIDKENSTVVKKIKVEGYSAFFNDHQWHGSFDHYPLANLTVKVEGKFTEELRKSIGIERIDWYD